MDRVLGGVEAQQAQQAQSKQAKVPFKDGNYCGYTCNITKTTGNKTCQTVMAIGGEGMLTNALMNYECINYIKTVGACPVTCPE